MSTDHPPPPPPPPPDDGFPPPPPGYGAPAYPGGGFGPGPGAKGHTPYGPASGWWARVGATVVDYLVLLIPSVALVLFTPKPAGSILSSLVYAVYAVLLISRSGQTLGNKAVGTRVVDSATGATPSLGKALGRWAAEAVLLPIIVIPLLLSILWPLWDRRNQTLHDKIAGTLVIETE